MKPQELLKNELPEFTHALPTELALSLPGIEDLEAKLSNELATEDME